MVTSTRTMSPQLELARAYRPLTKLLAARMPQDPSQKDYEETFAEVDADKDGSLTFEEFEAWLRQQLQANGGYNTASQQSLRLLFEMVDADGSGALQQSTEASLFFKMLNSFSWCNSCKILLDPLLDEGVRCIPCQQQVLASQMEASDATTLCTSCHQTCCTTLTPACRFHPQPTNKSIRPSSEVAGDEPPVLALQLALPDGALGLQCSCCGEIHDIVKSYLDANEDDLHMRPTKDGGGFLCEWCAVRVCKCPTNNMKWLLEKPAKGLAGGKRHKCSTWLGSCKQLGTARSSEQVDLSARSRCAAGCRTCTQKLNDGWPLQQPRLATDTALGSAAGDGAGSLAESSSNEDSPVQLNLGTALEIGMIACVALEKIGKTIPIVGPTIQGVASSAAMVFDLAKAVPYNKAKADSLLRRTSMAARYVEGVLVDLQREALNCLSDSQSSLLCSYLEELERAMAKARDLLLRWKKYAGAQKAVQKLSRLVLNKMDIDDLKDVDNTMSKAMSDIGSFLTGLIALHQIDFRREIAAALTAAEEVKQDQQQAANMKDMASVQADLLQVVGSVEELKRQLAEDRQLTQEWQQQVLPLLKAQGVAMDKLDAAVTEILTDVKEIKVVVNDIDQKMDQQAGHLGNMHDQLKEVNRQLSEVKQWFKHNSHTSGRRKKLPRLLITSQSVRIDESSRGSMGSGAFGQVYKAKWRGLDVAVKKLRLEGLEPEEADKVYREALILSHLSHPCIVHFYGLIDEGSPVSNPSTRLMQGGLVMELCDGSLQNLLDREQIELATAINIAWQIAQGLNYIHNEAPIRLVHSDLKPQNILIKSGQVKICDFGLSDALSMTSTMGSFMAPPHGSYSGAGGTLLWSPPEVLSVMGRPGATVVPSVSRDVYAFGMILYELLTRKRPFAELGRMSDYEFVRRVVGDEYTPGVRPAGLAQWRLKLQQLDRDSGGVSSELADHLVRLVEQCWDANPAVRPTTLQLLDVMDQINDLCSTH